MRKSCQNAQKKTRPTSKSNYKSNHLFSKFNQNAVSKNLSPAGKSRVVRYGIGGQKIEKYLKTQYQKSRFSPYPLARL